ncbi:MAG: hypothetical protein HC854_11210 [Flavobacterium sp.]|nr:hypothetical protein [Flavobacterium sp.]
MKNFISLFFLTLSISLFSQEAINISDEEFVELQAKARSFFIQIEIALFITLIELKNQIIKFTLLTLKGQKVI